MGTLIVTFLPLPEPHPLTGDDQPRTRVHHSGIQLNQYCTSVGTTPYFRPPSKFVYRETLKNLNQYTIIGSVIKTLEIPVIVIEPSQ